MGILDELKGDAVEFGVTLGILLALVAGLWLWKQGTWAIIMVAILVGIVFFFVMMRKR